MNVELRDEARDDLVNGAVFYGEQSNGLDEYFLKCLREDVEIPRRLGYGRCSALQSDRNHACILKHRAATDATLRALMEDRKKVTFPNRPAAWYDIERHTITFPVIVDDQRLACVVTASSLMNYFTRRNQFTPLEARAVYEEHKDTVRRLADADIRARGTLEHCEELTITLLDDDCRS